MCRVLIVVVVFQVACCLMFVVWCVVFAVCRLLDVAFVFVVWCALFVVCCLLLRCCCVVGCLMCGRRCSLLIGCIDVCCMRFDVLLFVVCCVVRCVFEVCRFVLLVVFCLLLVL